MLILLDYPNSTPNDKMKGKIVDVLEKGYKIRRKLFVS
jgi:molecular chaperone GrpE (heat shock protein)